MYCIADAVLQDGSAPAAISTVDQRRYFIVGLGLYVSN